MSAGYVHRPLSDRTWLRPPGARVRSLFTASWSDTLELLDRELGHLRARQVVLELDVREQDLRIDGRVKANARPASEAVVVAFESKHGPLQYRSDLYGLVAYGDRNGRPWQANVRAVALTLKALRDVDRYGATTSGEQYRGFKQLGAGTGLEATSMTTDTALRIIQTESRTDLVGFTLARGELMQAVRTARANAHPDRNGGDRSRWNAVDEAEQVLRRAGRLS